MVTCAAFIAPDMNKAHVITPAVDSDVAPESAEKRAPNVEDGRPQTPTGRQI